jgi:hypothetical protein
VLALRDGLSHNGGMALPAITDTREATDVPVALVRELAAEGLTIEEIAALLCSPVIATSSYEGKTAQKKRNGGPKFKRIDLEELEKLCALQCTQPELADWFGVSLATIERRLQRSEYREVMARGRALGRISLRRMQWQAARAGNAAMLIWLGRQYLGQSNNPAPQPGELPSSIRAVYRSAEPAPQLPPISPPALASANGSESTAEPRARPWLDGLLAGEPKYTRASGVTFS